MENRHGSFKQEGEWAEMMFQCEATRRGLIVSKPFGDNQAYDFLVDTEDRILRVQVKSTNHKVPNGKGYRYRIDVCYGTKRQMYSPEVVDMFAIFIVPENAWYLIPVDAITSIKNSFYPHMESSTGKFEEYKERWEIFSYYGN